MATSYLIWDFDGTLGYREGGMWSGTLRDILCEALPGCTVTADELRAQLRVGYPWHTPEISHPELCDADAWWAALQPVFVRALVGVGTPPSLAPVLAGQFRARYTDFSRWRLFPDSFPVLGRLAAQGWRHVLLSNHVPELPDIVRHLGLDYHFDHIFNSAETGYEKPHPQAFRNVLSALPEVENIWMIGDNYLADIQGAAALGIPGVLVRASHVEARYCCADLPAAAELILQKALVTSE